MIVKSFKPTEESIFKSFSQQNQPNSFLQSWDWGNWQAFNRKQVLRLGVWEENDLLATATIIENLVPVLHKSYLYVPYGPVFKHGLIESKKLECIQFLITHLKQTFPKEIYIKIEPQEVLTIAQQSHKGPRIQPGDSLILDLEPDQNLIHDSFHKKTRYSIRLAKKHEVKVKTFSVANPTDTAIRLLTDTARRQGFKTYQAKYFADLVNFFKPESEIQATVYQSMHREKIVASAIMLDFADTRTYLFGGSDYDQRKYMGPHLLHWQAIIDAKIKGLKHYDWWGLHSSTGESAGFARFKLSFGGKQVQYPEAIEIPIKSLWYNSYKLVKKLKQTLKI